ncbi:MltR family transcriptional regulator [Aliidiomarina shirensis]|uniref:MltR family transcriptional regulator n=1 Tax=Aliidiomarina shirensis TaxID=1048642 RepID=UPI00130089D4|nr:MltR family transcriptional regulator [Aliidiomarina shirensis]
MKPEEFINKRSQEVLAFRKALTKETDRGCALFATSYLDKALSDLLYCALAHDKKIKNDLFEGNAPLASFSSRIKLAFYLGKISKIERRDLDLLRKIRNEFAHNADAIDFEVEKIKSQCGELSFSYHEKDHRPRGHFTAACLGILANIHNETLLCQAPEIKADNAPSEERKKKARDDAQRKYEEAKKNA